MTKDPYVTLRLTLRSRFELMVLGATLDACIWLAFWLRIDLSDWAEQLTDGVLAHLKYDVIND